MSKLKTSWGAFKSSECGATAIEYALIAAILSLSIVTGLLAVSGELSLVFGDVVLGFSG